MPQQFWTLGLAPAQGASDMGFWHCREVRGEESGQGFPVRQAMSKTCQGRDVVQSRIPWLAMGVVSVGMTWK